MLKEKLMKIFKENKNTKGVNQKVLVSLCEKIDTEIDTEAEKRVKERLNEETNKIKSQLSEKYKKDNETFMESYKKVFNSNIEKKLDKVFNALYTELKKQINVENDKLIDEYVSERMKMEANSLKEEVIKFSKQFAEEYVEKESKLMNEFIEKQKEEYFTEKILNTVKTLGWENKVENNEAIKKLVEENNNLKKKYSEMKQKSLKVYKEKIFNENFNSLTDMKKEEIKKYIDEEVKPKNIKEYKEACKKILESRTVKKTILEENTKYILNTEKPKPSWEQFI